MAVVVVVVVRTERPRFVGGGTAFSTASTWFPDGDGSTLVFLGIFVLFVTQREETLAPI